MTPAPKEKEMDLFSLILLFWPYRMGILKITVGILLVGWAAIFLLASNRYESSALFLPPSLKDDTMPFLSIGMDDDLLGKGGVSKLLGSSSSPAIGVVESLDVRLAVVDRLKLTDRYGTESRLEAAEFLEGRTTVREEESGSITMSVQDSNPDLSKEILVAYLHEIKKRSESIIKEKVSHMATYLEGRSRQTEVDLNNALLAWQKYQETTQVFQVDATAKSLSDILSNLVGTVAQAEAELRAIETSAGQQDPIVIQQKTYIKELYNHINRLKGLRGTDNEQGKEILPAKLEEILPKGSELPKLAAAEQRFRLEVESKVKIAALLKSQFEMARLALIREEQHMVTLDPPVIPDKPTQRKKKLAFINILLAVLGGLGYGGLRIFWEKFKTRVLAVSEFPEVAPVIKSLESVIGPKARKRDADKIQAQPPIEIERSETQELQEVSSSEPASKEPIKATPDSEEELPPPKVSRHSKKSKDKKTLHEQN